MKLYEMIRFGMWIEMYWAKGENSQDEVNVEKISAELVDGVLRVVLPKAEEAKPKQIEVKVR